jgi:hypothetical protein
LNYGNYWLTGEGGEEAANAGTDNVFRFSGGFESVTDGQTLWIRSEDITVPVSLKNAESYRLPARKNEGLSEGDEQEGSRTSMMQRGTSVPSDLGAGLRRPLVSVEAPGETPEIIRWGKSSALNEGTKVFVGGSLKYLNGSRSFVSTKENPLIVIFYDCTESALVPQMIQSGRQQNEYWNSITPYSLVIGAISLLLTALLFRSRPAYSLTVVVSVIALFIPLYPIIPPGLLFTGIYRRLSRMSGVLRARGDLARLSEQISAARFTVKAYLLEVAAWFFLLAGLARNIFFLRLVLIRLGVLF